MDGLIGRKVGMTQLFDEKGARVAVTIIQAGPCVVVQRKTLDRDGYEAVQLGFGARKESRLTRAEKGHFKKYGVPPCRYLQEFPVVAGEDVKAGDTVNVSIFQGVSHVDVTARSKGRGFQGVVKRHRMAGGPVSHGSMSHRRPGAIGQRAKPGNIAKGQRMPGHMGHRRVTTQNLRIIQVRPDENLLFLEGAVPGPAGGLLVVRKALKKQVKKVS